MTTLRLSSLSCLLGVLALCCAKVASAQGFAAYVSPPRVVVEAKAGERLRQVIEIQHGGARRGAYRLYTSDWTLDAEGGVNFSNALAADSCRPWVAIERRELSLEPGARYRYRFEITPPADTPPRECRFAIMIEGAEPVRVEGSINVPVNGRIGVIVYAAIGGAAPQLEILATKVAQIGGQPTAMLDVRNTGNAHGRLEGYVNGTDAAGARFELAPADAPILPGQTRRIALAPVGEDGKPAPVVRFPLQVRGQLEWGGKNRLPLDASFAP